ncbi:MAG TPA: glutathionylspermidine synthase family protein [Tepidisphaeraceae bacterium]|nr:glutathionylspermidine synthase family protein [Tepidisphaeraceae bacterium]
MLRIPTQPRANWQSTVESQGFHFHTIDDAPYWDESVCYLFNARQVDQIEAATYALNDMCLKAVQHVIDRNLFHLFLIPPEIVPWVVRSWEQDEFTLYGRFDLAYDGRGDPKLLEYNADTPTSLLEAAVIQWFWLKEVEKHPGAFSPELARHAGASGLDQFNSLHERLIEAWGAYGQILRARRAANPQVFNPTMYFTCASGHVEDFMTTQYLRDTAAQAFGGEVGDDGEDDDPFGGFGRFGGAPTGGEFPTEFIPIEQIGFNHPRQLFVDARERPIHNLFKLYPWEWLVREQFGPMIPRTLVHWLEAPWKMLLSNKAILPILWELFPRSPYLLPASFQPINGPHVRKPILSREGANVSMVIGGKVVIETPGPYGAGPFVYQQLQPLPDHQGHLPVVGSWMVNGYASGIGIREDTSPITGNTSRFVPHLFVR